MSEKISDELALRVLEKSREKAGETLNDPDKTEELLRRIEEKLRQVPIAGGALSRIPTLVSLLRSYIKKEYTVIPVGSILAVTGAIIYWVTPVDLIPDLIPGVGQVDDARVVAACLRLVKSDLDDYRIWREEKDMNKEIPLG